MIKTLAGSIRQYRTPSVLTMIMMTVESLVEIFIPLLMGRLIDFGIQPGAMGEILRYGVMLLSLALFQLLMGALSALYSARAAAGLASNLRQDMYDRVQTFSFYNIDRFSTASIVTRLTTDVTNVQMAYQMALRTAVRSPVLLVLAVVFSFRISREIASMFLLVIPVLSVGLFLLVRKAFPLFQKVFKTYDKLNNVVQEDLRGIRVVKTFNREDSEIDKFQGVSSTIYRDFSRAERLITLIFPLMQTCVYTLLIVVFWLGAQGILESGNNPALGLTAGSLTALLSYQMQIVMSLMMLCMIFTMLMISQASAERIAQVLTEESTIQNSADPLKEALDGSIRFENVGFVYDAGADKRVLDGINLDIASGETIGILGGTGSAKSSLVQLIPRLYDATEGAVFVGGADVRAYDLETLREAVAMVLQKNELFSGTIRENLRWGNPDATEAELEEACRLACAHEFITGFAEGYDTKIEQGGTNLSGGQKQRLCIARALLKRPKILILDDSTSAVDTRTDSRIQEGFAHYIPETTKLIIAQRISSIEKADRIVVLDDGRISGVGTHEELLANNEIYREVYDSQQKGGEALA